MSRPDVQALATRLRDERVPYVHARVVLAERPTSAKPGDEAIVRADGTIEGFVGGSCAESTVRLESLALLGGTGPGEPVLLRITPDAGTETAVAKPGTRTVHNPCLSGGSMEIFLDPVLPAPLMLVLAGGPIAAALSRVGAAADLQVRVVDQAAAEDHLLGASTHPHGGWTHNPGDHPAVAAAVVASHGRDEIPVLQAALAAGVPYVALVASRKRGAGVLTELADLGVPAELRGRVHTPAGLDIGARTPAEIAVSIVAEIISLRRAAAADEAPVPCVADLSGTPTASTTPAVAIDPVCGMNVAAVEASLHLDHAGTRYYFCRPDCRQSFSADPARYLA